MSKKKYTTQQFITELPNLEKQTWESVRVFLLAKRIFNSSSLAKVFWLSDLPIIHFDTFSNETLFESYLLQYFSRDENVNQSFLKLFPSAPQSTTVILKSCIKQNRAFDKKDHWLSFEIFNTSSNELKLFYKELAYIIKLQQDWETNSQKLIPFLNTYSYEEILLHSIAYYEKLKRRIHEDNFTEITLLEFNFIQVLETILKLAEKQDGEIFSKADFDYYKKFALPPRWTSKDMSIHLEPEEEIDDRKVVFRGLLDFYLEMSELEYHLNLYLAGYAEFKSIGDVKATLKTTPSFIAYRKSLDKGKYDDTFFVNSLMKNDKLKRSIKREGYGSFKSEIELSVAAEMKYFDFYEIKLSNKIDLYKLLKILKSLALLIMPARRIFLVREDGVRYEVKRDLPSEFKRTFESDFIVCYSEERLIEKIRKYFHYPIEEIKELLNFLTLDLISLKGRTVDFTANPLVKLDDLYYWPAAFLRDRRWSVILHRKFIAENILLHQEQSEKLEAKVSSWFKKAGFNAVSSFEYTHGSKKGEIDVLAFRDNTLFIIELKNTYIVEDVINTSKYYTRNFKSKASDQLDKSEQYVRSNFEELKKDDCLNISCDLIGLKIVTIILSNSYVSDETIFNKKHYKISMFELMIILTNNLKNMHYSQMGKLLFNKNVVLPIDYMLNGFNKDFLQNKRHSLWANNKNCSALDLISAIKEGKVYAHMADYENRFSDIEIHLDKFDMS